MTTAVIQDGRTMTFPATGTLSAGDVIEFNDCIGVVVDDAVSGDNVTLIMMGVVELTKETGVAFAAGDALYWDATNDRLDATATNIPAGICWAAAASGDVLARVSLGLGLAAAIA